MAAADRCRSRIEDAAVTVAPIWLRISTPDADAEDRPAARTPAALSTIARQTRQLAELGAEVLAPQDERPDDQVEHRGDQPEAARPERRGDQLGQR